MRARAVLLFLTLGNRRNVQAWHCACLHKSRGTNKELFFPERATWLGGIGSGAWFQIVKKECQDTYKIARYSASGQKDFEGIFRFDEEGFDPTQEYQFVHPTNCLEAFVHQKGKKFSLKKMVF